VPTTYHVLFYDGPCGGRTRAVTLTGNAPKTLRCGGREYRAKESPGPQLTFVLVGGLNDTPADQPLHLPAVLLKTHDVNHAWRRLMRSVSFGLHNYNRRVWQANARVRRVVR
jgi:hypothetical protein